MGPGVSEMGKEVEGRRSLVLVEVIVECGGKSIEVR